MKIKFEKIKEQNAHLNSLAKSLNLNKKTNLENEKASINNKGLNNNLFENIENKEKVNKIKIISNNHSIYENDLNNDENLKEITVLMKKILDD